MNLCMNRQWGGMMTRYHEIEWFATSFDNTTLSSDVALKSPRWAVVITCFIRKYVVGKFSIAEN